jgi:hypothetical protein
VLNLRRILHPGNNPLGRFDRIVRLGLNLRKLVD